MRYLVTARVKAGRRAALDRAIDDGTLGRGSVAGGEVPPQHGRRTRATRTGACSGSRSATARRRSPKSASTGSRISISTKVQDAHARSRCRDLNGTEPWSCGDCDCSAASKRDSPRPAASSAYNFAVASSSLHALLARAGAALERGRGSEAAQMLTPTLRSSLTRDDELAVRAMLAEAAAPAGRSRSGGGSPRPDPGHVPRHGDRRPVVHAVAAARPARLGPRRPFARHRASAARAEAGGKRARLPRHRPGPLRARALLPPGWRHRHRPRAHHQGRLGAPRGGRPSPPGARPLALEHLARAARTLRRGDDGAAPGGARRLARPGRRRAGDGVRQSGQRDDAAAPLRAGAGAGGTERVAPRGARFRPWARRGAGHARTDSASASAISAGPRRRFTARSTSAVRFSFTKRPAPCSTR